MSWQKGPERTLGRRELLRRAAGIALLSGGAAGAAASERRQSAGRGKENGMEALWVFVGTRCERESRGIYRFRFDPATGVAGPVTLAAESIHPTFLAVHPGGKFLYSVNAVSDFQGQKSGAVSAFAMDTGTGELSLLNQQPSGGAGPCHLVVDSEGKTVLVANYAGGSVASLPLGRDGRLAAPSSVIRHTGSSVDPKRQEAPHAHSITLDPANRFAFAVDLGMDKVLVYRFDATEGELCHSETPSATLAPGAGPRHLALHPSGRFAYVINELNSTVTAFDWTPETGRLREIQTLTTLPDGFSGENYPAEVLVHPSGKFLYGSNRGHDSIAIYEIDGAGGKLTPAGHQPSGGRGPRNFAIDPSGAWMVVGNQSSDNILVFRIDPARGTLAQAGPALAAPVPICFKFVPISA